MNRISTLLLFLLLALLSGCSALLPDPLTAEQHLAQAEAFKAKRDYAAAADSLAKAIRKQPADGSLHLQHGELLEVAGMPEQARKTYRKGLETIAGGDSSRPELNYRLLQLLTLKLSAPDEAEPLLTAISAGSVRHLDARGCLAYGRGRHQEALQLFDQARLQTTDQDLTARILYHVALAYHQLGDDDHAMLALFHAINQAQSLGVSKDIEYFFNDLKGLTP
ncbi:tetratricopeptide repeat protein [Trichloromonas sp.]|uniref:tetratricopeptide repeat protein n=1 Tax=Trichloromonas sp. TaxID=3069249 RepID=UPI003D81BD68